MIPRGFAQTVQFGMHFRLDFLVRGITIYRLQFVWVFLQVKDWTQERQNFKPRSIVGKKILRWLFQ